MRVSDSIRLHYPQYWGFGTYPADRACAVSKIAAEWGVFSNFARTPLVVDGVPFSPYLSIGVSLYSDTENLSEQISQAEARMAADSSGSRSVGALADSMVELFHLYDNLPISCAVYYVPPADSDADADRKSVV